MSGQQARDKLDNLAPATARAMIRSLTRGTTIRSGARHFHVGHDNWLAAQQELLEEIAEDSHSDTKFVRGAYGSGKSHFLAMVQDAARQANWATTHVECKADGVQIDRFETLYPRVVTKLQFPDVVSDDTTIDSVRHLLDRWTAKVRASAGLSEEAVVRPFDGEARMHRRLENDLLRSNLPSAFVRALCAFARASIAGDLDLAIAICRWVRGEVERVRVPDRYCRPPSFGRQDESSTELRPIGKGSAVEAMRALLWLVKAAGYAGLVLCIDEIEELAKLTTRKRQDQALQALREFVDHAGGEGGFRHLCVYLAATPEMFESESYFPRYDALATRIQPVSSELNWRGPVIDLDRTPLAQQELRELAERICTIHEIAYSDLGRHQALIDEAVSLVADARFRDAKPRLLARVIVDHLERSRLSGSNGVKDIKQALRDSATSIAKEAVQ